MKVNSKNYENIEIKDYKEENLNFNKPDYQKNKDIDLISSFNDSGFLNDDDDMNNEKDNQKKTNLDFMNKISENNLLIRENEQLKNKLTTLTNNSQKLLKVLENPKKYLISLIIN